MAQRQLPTDSAKVPAMIQGQRDRGGNPNWTFLGPVKGGKTKNVYGVEVIKAGHVMIWRRKKGSWSRQSGSGHSSIAAAKRDIARFEGVLND